METKMIPVTTEIRIAHLTLLTQGKEVINQKNHKQLILITAIGSAISIAGTILLYENRMRKLKDAHKDEIGKYLTIQEGMEARAKHMAELLAVKPFSLYTPT